MHHRQVLSGQFQRLRVLEHGQRLSTICSTQSLCYKNALREIKEGRPCILSLTNTYSGSNHYVLVIGYVKGTTEDNVCLSSFIVLDPVTASKRYLGDVHNYVDRYSNQIIRFQE